MIKAQLESERESVSRKVESVMVLRWKCEELGREALALLEVADKYDCFMFADLPKLTEKEKALAMEILNFSDYELIVSGEKTMTNVTRSNSSFQHSKESKGKLIKIIFTDVLRRCCYMSAYK